MSVPSGPSFRLIWPRRARCQCNDCRLSTRYVLLRVGAWLIRGMRESRADDNRMVQVIRNGRRWWPTDVSHRGIADMTKANLMGSGELNVPETYKASLQYTRK